LEAFHASVELYRAAATHTTEQLRQRVQSHITEENELVIAPRFFLALKEHLPQISAVEVMPKRGRTANELTKYRYDVILHVGQAVPSIAVPWLDWQEQGLSISKLRQMLEDCKGEVLGLMQVPNTRVAADTQIMSLMANQETLQTVAELREAVGRIQGQGLNPEELWELGEQVGYTVEVSWASSGAEGRFDVVFRQPVSSFEEEGSEVRREAVAWPGTEQALVRPWSSYANRPLGRTLFRKLVPKLRSYLEERLPDYMVPAAFVTMEAMPLTPSGKIDRRALPALDPEHREAAHLYEAPRTPIEEKLTEIWSSVLQREHIGICDNFFELGGHSLLAVRLMSEIEKQLGQKIPLVSLFQGATIEHLADILRKDVGTIAWPTLVEIQAGGLRPPLFCVSMPNVNALGYRTLARYLGPSQPVFGLQAQCAEDLEEEFSQAAVDRIATDYLESLRAVRPTGPYQFVGICRGAHIAFEMARRLEQEGERVSFLGILDTWVVENTYSIFFHLEHYAGRLVWLTRLGVGEQISFIKKKAQAALSFGDKTSKPADIAKRKLHELYFPGPDFVPRTYGGRITVFRVQQQPRQRVRDPQLGWGKLARGGVDLHFIPGDHTNVLKEPHVQGLAAEMKKCLLQSSEQDPLEFGLQQESLRLDQRN
jgi:thioesterase domain-containing protein/acyl carrier protein